MDYNIEEEILGQAFDLRLIRRLIKFLVPYKLMFLIAAILVFALTAIEIAMPYITKIAIDRYMTLQFAVATLPPEEPIDSAIILFPLSPLHDEFQENVYLVDLRSLPNATRIRWQEAGYIGIEQYLFIAEDAAAVAVVAGHPELFIPLQGGYAIREENLILLPQNDRALLRESSLHGILLLTIVFTTALVLRFGLNAVQAYILQLTGQRVMYDIRQKIFAHILRLPIRFFDRTPVGRVVTRTTNDVAAINEMYTMVLVTVFRDFFLIIGIFIIMLRIDWQLALFIFGFTPFLFFTALKFRSYAREAFRDIRRTLAKLNAFIHESISGMEIIHLFAQEIKSNSRFSKINAEKYQAEIKQMLSVAVFNPIMGIMGSLAVATIIWYGGFDLLRGGLSFGTLVAFISYISLFFQPIMHLSQSYNVLQGAMASSERIFMLLDEKEEDRGKGRVIPDFKGEVEFRNVWFAYNEGEWVLRGVSFKATLGERVAIVGPTGSGKTTIISLLMRLYPIQRGQILLDNVPIEELDIKFLRSHLSVVLQDVFLFSGDIIDNIRLKAAIPEEEAIAAAKFVNADFIDDMPDGYYTDIRERGAILSTGERQILSFARAVAFKPQILVLDEATANIDSHTENLIQNSLRKIMQNRTSLVIAHRLSTIREADKIIVLSKGQIIEEGTHDQLLEQGGLYATLHALQFAATKCSTDIPIMAHQQIIPTRERPEIWSTER
ncbi:ABC transporter ATP-binding protein/permease [Candidatus Acetothermia bacterium]|nr:ABC transporter ATP-binding protein/permease [Candidatus Acetothermia bacterium]